MNSGFYLSNEDFSHLESILDLLSGFISIVVDQTIEGLVNDLESVAKDHHLSDRGAPEIF